MDRYEYKLKLEQIRNLVNDKDYQTAASIADTINWKKVKNASTLCMVGEIFEQVQRYEESKEILHLAYERSPLGRTIIYRLTQVAVKLGSIEEATEYYEEFLEIAPNNNMKYVLKYEIAKAQGARQEELIEILEEFKEREYIEEWIFELAYLYHKSEMEEKCVEICDELILWFGDGEHVEKALELKMLYQPLNPLQEKKYNQILQSRDGIVRISPTESFDSDEIVTDSVQIQPVTSGTGQFSTTNLQEELAKSMEQIIHAKEKETVSNSMNNIKRMVKDVSFLDSVQAKYMADNEEMSEDLKKQLTSPIEQQQTISKTLKEEEHDIQQDHHSQLMNQITDKMQIGDILDDWEKIKDKVEQQESLEESKAELPTDQKNEVPGKEKIPNTYRLRPTVKDTIPLPNLKLPHFLKSETAPIPDFDISEEKFINEALKEPNNEIDWNEQLTEEQKKYFSYFVSVDGMEQQISHALKGVLHHKQNKKNTTAGNIVIFGGKGSGKTVLAANIIKVLKKETKNPEAKVGKITGLSLNQKDIWSLLKKVEGGYLIIEKAGEMSKDSILTLSGIMEKDNQGLVVILEDTKVGIEKIFSRSAQFANKFTERIKIPVFTSNELVAFAQNYANERQYEIDEMGILALYNCISNIQKLDDPTNLEEIKEIMDSAIKKSSKGKLVKLFGSRKYNDQGYTYLREKDFDE